MLRSAFLVGVLTAFVLSMNAASAGRRRQPPPNRQLRLGLKTLGGKAGIVVDTTSGHVRFSVNGKPAATSRLGKQLHRAGRLPFEVRALGRDTFEFGIPRWQFSVRAHFVEGFLRETKVYQRVEVNTWRNWTRRVAAPLLHASVSRRIEARDAASLAAVRQALRRSTVPLQIHKGPLIRRIRPWERTVYEAGSVRVEVRPGFALWFERTLIGIDTETSIFRLPHAYSDAELRIRSGSDE